MSMTKPPTRSRPAKYATDQDVAMDRACEEWASICSTLRGRGKQLETVVKVTDEVRGMTQSLKSKELDTALSKIENKANLVLNDIKAEFEAAKALHQAFVDKSPDAADVENRNGLRFLAILDKVSEGMTVGDLWKAIANGTVLEINGLDKPTLPPVLTESAAPKPAPSKKSTVKKALKPESSNKVTVKKEPTERSATKPAANEPSSQKASENIDRVSLKTTGKAPSKAAEKNPSKGANKMASEIYVEQRPVTKDIVTKVAPASKAPTDEAKASKDNNAPKVTEAIKKMKKYKIAPKSRLPEPWTPAEKAVQEAKDLAASKAQKRTVAAEQATIPSKSATTENSAQKLYFFGSLMEEVMPGSQAGASKIYSASKNAMTSAVQKPPQSVISGGLPRAGVHKADMASSSPSNSSVKKATESPKMIKKASDKRDPAQVSSQGKAMISSKTDDSAKPAGFARPVIKTKKVPKALHSKDPTNGSDPHRDSAELQNAVSTSQYSETKLSGARSAKQKRSKPPKGTQSSASVTPLGKNGKPRWVYTAKIESDSDTDFESTYVDRHGAEEASEEEEESIAKKPEENKIPGLTGADSSALSFENIVGGPRRSSSGPAKRKRFLDAETAAPRKRVASEGRVIARLRTRVAAPPAVDVEMVDAGAFPTTVLTDAGAFENHNWVASGRFALPSYIGHDEEL